MLINGSRNPASRNGRNPFGRAGHAARRRSAPSIFKPSGQPPAAALMCLAPERTTMRLPHLGKARARPGRSRGRHRWQRPRSEKAAIAEMGAKLQASWRVGPFDRQRAPLRAPATLARKGMGRLAVIRQPRLWGSQSARERSVDFRLPVWIYPISSRAVRMHGMRQHADPAIASVRVRSFSIRDDDRLESHGGHDAARR